MITILRGITTYSVIFFIVYKVLIRICFKKDKYQLETSIRTIFCRQRKPFEPITYN